MRCPQCGERETRVVDSRDLDDAVTIRRRRLEGIARWRDRDASSAAQAGPDGRVGESPPSAPIAVVGAAPFTVETARVRPNVRRLERFAGGVTPA